MLRLISDTSRKNPVLLIYCEVLLVLRDFFIFKQ